MVGQVYVKLTLLQRERWCTWMLAGASAVLAELLLRQSLVAPPNGNDAYLAALVSLGGIFAGFMATLNTMLFAMNDRTRKRLEESGYDKDLRRYIVEAIYGALAVCIFSLLAFFVKMSHEVHAMLIGAVAFSLAAIIRVTEIGTRLLSMSPRH